MNRVRPSTALCVAVAFATALARPLLAADSAAGLEFFERKVRPVLAENCYDCHGAEKQKGKLRLDSAGAIRAGGESGAIVVAGNPEQSRLITGISYGDPEFKMPPKKKLSAAQIADLTAWVKLGASMPAGEAAPVAAAPKEFTIAPKVFSSAAF